MLGSFVTLAALSLGVTHVRKANGTDTTVNRFTLKPLFLYGLALAERFFQGCYALAQRSNSESSSACYPSWKKGINV
ncbi:hypothetical protein AALB_1194 [Agarivorans albus MKT 106]|uniref:Uncharacterized protein n=1 Tax=Agarivorans albus MKT 106 TaxID=1331007 RepID=R9PI96_AGAAL|nr:hypothetical protein AALB_1194 [Agarivorans albus MKT 106]